MMRLLVFLMFWVWACSSGHAQGRIRNIRLRVLDSSTIEVLYDLAQARSNDSVFFEIRSRIRGPLRIASQFVQGDVGTQVKAGYNRRIVWNARANGYALNEEIQARVFIKARSLSRSVRPMVGIAGRAPQAAGPTPARSPQPPVAVPPVNSRPPDSVRVNPAQPAPQSVPIATLPAQPVAEKASPAAPDSIPARPSPVVTDAPRSQPVPVRPAPADQPLQTVRPQPVSWRISNYKGAGWALVSAIAPGIGSIFVQTPNPKVGLRPLLTVGCYGLLIYGFAERKQAQDAYAIYEQQKNRAAAEPYYQTANGHHQRYFLATRTALLVAAADVVLTFIKGTRNTQLEKKGQRFSHVGLRPGLQAGQPTAVLQYSF